MSLADCCVLLGLYGSGLRSRETNCSDGGAKLNFAIIFISYHKLCVAQIQLCISIPSILLGLPSVCII